MFHNVGSESESYYLAMPDVFVSVQSTMRGAHGTTRPGHSVQHISAQHDPGVRRPRDGDAWRTPLPRV